MNVQCRGRRPGTQGPCLLVSVSAGLQPGPEPKRSAKPKLQKTLDITAFSKLKAHFRRIGARIFDRLIAAIRRNFITRFEILSNDIR